MPDLGRLTAGELSTTTTALAWLAVNMKDRGILEPAVTAKLTSLLVDCHNETSARKLAESRAREAAAADRMARED